MAAQVLNSIQNDAGDRCIDIFRRSDGTFGFEEYRRDFEDRRGWLSLQRYSNLVSRGPQSALVSATVAVSWLAEKRGYSTSQKSLGCWGYADIALAEPDRARYLESAPSADILIEKVVSTFVDAARSGDLRVGMDQSGLDRTHLRAVLQVHAGTTLEDQLLNARSGVRAAHREGWRKGHEYNRRIVDGVRDGIRGMEQLIVRARLLTHEFQDCGEIDVSWAQIIESLEPNLSKIWFCARLIDGRGKVLQLPTGATDSRIRVDDDTTWPSIARNEDDAWFDLKGAHVGPDGPYQRKDPVDRALALHETGEPGP